MKQSARARKRGILRGRGGGVCGRGKELCQGTRLKRIELSGVELFYIMMVDMHRGN